MFHVISDVTSSTKLDWVIDNNKIIKQMNSLDTLIIERRNGYLVPSLNDDFPQLHNLKHFKVIQEDQGNQHNYLDKSHLEIVINIPNPQILTLELDYSSHVFKVD